MVHQKEAPLALVTGATGFVGSHVARALLKSGRRVRVLVRPTSSLKNILGLPVETVVGDLCDRPSVDRAIKGCDEVYHVAAEYKFWTTDANSLYESNILGTRNVMELALRHSVKKVVYTSTVGTIGLGAARTSSLSYPIFDENSPMLAGQFSGHYKRSKYEAEQLVLSFVERGLPVVIVNPSTPIGTHDIKPTPSGKIIVDFINGKMPAYIETGLNVVDVEDVARGHILAAENGRIGERYILGNQNMSLLEILRLLSEITGLAHPKIRIPYTVAFLAGVVSTKYADWVSHKPPSIALESVKMAQSHMYFSSQKAIKEIGYTQQPVRLSFENAVKWFAQNRYLNLEQLSKQNRGKMEWLSH